MSIQEIVEQYIEDTATGVRVGETYTEVLARGERIRVNYNKILLELNKLHSHSNLEALNVIKNSGDGSLFLADDGLYKDPAAEALGDIDAGFPDAPPSQVTVQLRRGTASQWSSFNPVLQDGEIGIEKDTNRIKIGNGVDSWSALQYNNSGSTDRIYDEIPSGLKDGSNRTFITEFPYVTKSIELSVSGVKRTRGSEYDYTETGANSITLNFDVYDHDNIILSYNKQETIQT